MLHVVTTMGTCAGAVIRCAVGLVPLRGRNTNVDGWCILSVQNHLRHRKTRVMEITMGMMCPTSCREFSGEHTRAIVVNW